MSHNYTPPLAGSQGFVSISLDFKNSFIICPPLGWLVSLVCPLIWYPFAFADQASSSYLSKAVQCSLQLFWGFENAPLLQLGFVLVFFWLVVSFWKIDKFFVSLSKTKKLSELNESQNYFFPHSFNVGFEFALFFQTLSCSFIWESSISRNDFPRFSLHDFSYVEKIISPAALTSPLVVWSFLGTWFVDLFLISVKEPLGLFLFCLLSGNVALIDAWKLLLHLQFWMLWRFRLGGVVLNHFAEENCAR